MMFARCGMPDRWLGRMVSLVLLCLSLFAPARASAMQPTGDLAGCFKYVGRGMSEFRMEGEIYRNNCGKIVKVGVCMRNVMGATLGSVKAIGCVDKYVTPGEFAVTGGIISIVACDMDPILDEHTGTASCPEPKPKPASRDSLARSRASEQVAAQAAAQAEEERQLENDLQQLTERLSKGDPVNGCLKLIDKRGPGFEKAFQNTCSHPVQFSYCVEDAKSLFRCKVSPPRGEGMGSVGPRGWSAIPDWYNGGRIHWLACKGKLGEVLPMLNTNGKSGCF